MTDQNHRLAARLPAGVAIAVIAVITVGTAVCDCHAGRLFVPATQDPESAPASVLTRGPQRFSDILPEPLDLNAVPEFNDGGPMLAQAFDEFALEDEADKVNVTKAALYSLVLPGAGQWYAGEKNRAGVFLAGEGVMWAAFAYFKTVETIKRRDYEAYALANAGIEPEGKDDEFYRILSFYLSRDEYNSAGRIIDPSRPYYPDTEYWDWRWRSEAELSTYRDLRNQRSESRNRGRFALGGLLANRLISAFDAWRTAKKVNRAAKMELSEWKFGLKGKPFGDDARVMLTVGRKF